LPLLQFTDGKYAFYKNVNKFSFNLLQSDNLRLEDYLHFKKRRL